MKAVYVEETEKTLKHFVCGLKKDEDSCEEYEFKEITTIAGKAFYAPWNVKKVFFDENLTTIKKEAFKDCRELEVFCCGNKKIIKPEENIKLNELFATANSVDKKKSANGSALQNPVSEDNQKSEFIIEASAFVNCENLHTVVFPKCKILRIEKNAFSGCDSLRTVVAVTDENGTIDFTENPFKDCPKELVFVCSKNSAVERFARENGYRSINV